MASSSAPAAGIIRRAGRVRAGQLVRHLSARPCQAAEYLNDLRSQGRITLLSMDKPSMPDAGARRFIADRYGDRASGLTLLGAGEWSRAYAFTLDGQAAVARFGAYGDDFAKDQVMARFSTPGLPIPAVTEVGRTAHGYFAVSARAFGMLLDELDEAGLRAVLPSLLRALDAIRDIDVADSAGYGIWAPDTAGPYPSWQAALLSIADDHDRIAGWRRALQTSPAAAQAFAKAHATLQSMAAALPGARHIIHGDLLNRNVLVNGSGISAVIDWGNAAYGDWLYDAAWLLYWWPWYPAWQRIDIRAELDQHWKAGRGLPADLELRLRCYQLHIGLNAMTYNAFTGRFDDLARNAEQTMTLI
jgi:hygromycin-B 4-O-kinase